MQKLPLDRQRLLRTLSKLVYCSPVLPTNKVGSRETYLHDMTGTDADSEPVQKCLGVSRLGNPEGAKMVARGKRSEERAERRPG